MAITDSQYARIEAYLLNEMPDAERKAFEEECRQDPQLQTALDQERNLHKIVRIHAQMELRQKLQALQAQEKEPKAIPLRPTWYQQNRILISIAAILIVAIGAFFWPTSTLQLSDMMPPELAPQRSGADTLIVNNFVQWFNEENYNAILTEFRNLDSTQQQDETFQYLAGMARAGLGDYDPAIAHFKSIITPDNHKSGIPCSAKWALAYAYQQQGDPQKAFDALQLHDIDFDPDGNPKDFKAQFECLEADQYPKLEKMIKTLYKAIH